MSHVHIVDDDENVRDALAFLLSSRSLAAIAHVHGDAFLSAVQTGLVNTAAPACVLLDIRMPGASGLEVFSALKSLGLIEVLPVIFLTGHADLATAVSLVKSGAFDFAEKPFSDNDLIDRVEQALKASEAALLAGAHFASMQERLNALTSREREVMDLILMGKLNKVVGDALGISTRTVEVHRARIFAKMGVRTAIELANLLKTKE